MKKITKTQAGGCTCGHVRYEMIGRPLIVHGCHCRWCQRQSGGAFAINALIEADRVRLTHGEVHEIIVASPSGAGQRIARCPHCQIAVWSNYLRVGGKMADLIRFIRVGTLDDPDGHPPDVHIYTESKQPWFNLPLEVRAFDKFYSLQDTYSPDSLTRHNALKNRLRDNTAV
ncbi:GFA family protein [Primorskyibacter sedentarius]|nr:GFA family protein [Primorskyibacter sedentarius]